MADDYFFIQWRGKTSGPLSKADVVSQSKAGKISRHHMISSDQKQWRPAGELTWLFDPKVDFVYEPAHTPPDPDIAEVSEHVASEVADRPVETKDPKRKADLKTKYKRANPAAISATPTLICLALFIASYITACVLSVFLNIAINVERNQNSVLTLSVSLLSTLFVLFGCWIGVQISSTMFLYKCGTLIPENYRYTTPGKLAGFMFIPFFNLGWVFIALHTTSERTNAVLKDQGKEMCAPSGIGIAAGIFYCLSFLELLPLFGPIIVATRYLLFAIWVRGQADSINRYSVDYKRDRAADVWLAIVITFCTLIVALFVIAIALGLAIVGWKIAREIQVNS